MTPAGIEAWLLDRRWNWRWYLTRSRFVQRCVMFGARFDGVRWNAAFARWCVFVIMAPLNDWWTQTCVDGEIR